MKARLLGAAMLLGGGAFFGAHAQQPLPPPLTFVQPLSRSGVEAVQQQLRRAGDYRGRTDGIWGPDSLAALQRFQATHGLQVTGTLNQATVASLGLDPDMLLGARPPAMGMAAGQFQPGPRAVRAVQDRLARLGFYNGPIDGVWGPETQEAIARFQQSRGLQPNSQLNSATVAALGLPPQVLAAEE